MPERDCGNAFVKYNRVGFPFSLQGICLTDTKDSIAISDIVYCHACAMKYYFERNEPRTESDRYAICKQVSYHLGTPLDTEAIWQEVLCSSPGN